MVRFENLALPGMEGLKLRVNIQDVTMLRLQVQSRDCKKIALRFKSSATPKMLLDRGQALAEISRLQKPVILVLNHPEW